MKPDQSDQPERYEPPRAEDLETSEGTTATASGMDISKSPPPSFSDEE